jgi:uncharacterized low-complexity protein
MSKKTTALAYAVGAALVGPLAGTSLADTSANPFGITPLRGGYMQVAMEEAECGANKKAAEEKKEEAAKSMAAGSSEGKDTPKGSDSSDKKKDAEGSCGGKKKGD